MSDDPTDYSPFAKPAAKKQPAPRVEIWRLQKQGRIISCVIRDHTADHEGGWDVLLLDGNGELGLSTFAADEKRARFIAESWRQDYRTAGYDA